MKYDVGVWTGFSWLRIWSAGVGASEPSGTMKGGIFLDQLSEY